MNQQILNQITAKSCGILQPQFDNLNRFVLSVTSYWTNYKWDVEDARCRELIREHFKIISIYRRLAKEK